MNDIRRTILWVIFGFSMVLLWDQWQVYNGHKATFFPSGAKQAEVVAKAPTTGASGVPAPVASSALGVASAQVPGTTAPAVAAPREKLEVSTDVLKLTFDTEGGSLIGSELLK